jgi:hypothetical protein
LREGFSAPQDAVANIISIASVVILNEKALGCMEISLNGL